MATKCIESITRQIPSGATFTAEVCNNAYDAAPTWEDCTSRVIGGEKVFIKNQTKTAAKWGYSVRVSIERNGAVGDCWVSGGSGYFE